MGLFDSVRSLFGADGDDEDTDSETTEDTPPSESATVDPDSAVTDHDSETATTDAETPPESDGTAGATDDPESLADDLFEETADDDGETDTTETVDTAAGDDTTDDDASEEETAGEDTPAETESDDDEPISWEETGFEQLTTELVDDEEADPADLIQEAEPDREADTAESAIDEAESHGTRTDTDATETDDSDAETTADSESESTLLAGADGDVGLEETGDADVDVPEDSKRAEFLAAATELVEFWGEYDLDYTVDSLVRLDELIDEQWGPERFEDVEYGGEDYDSEVYTEVVTQVGSYLGEVFVRVHDGEWVEAEEVGWAVDVPAGPDAAAAGAGVTVFHIAQQCLGGEATVAGKHDGLATDLDLSPTAGVDPEPTELGGSGDGPAADTELTDRLQDSAEDFADRWPDYELDFSAASLSRLAELIETELDGERFAGAELGDETDQASMLLTAHAVGIGGYLAAVLQSEYDAEWDTERMAVVVDDEAVDPIEHAADCVRGTATLEDVVPE